MDLETLARLGIESTGPPKTMRSAGELDYLATLEQTIH